VIVNTCSVTAEAERTARAFLRRTHREHPEARILVTGCYAQRDPEALRVIKGVHAVIGNSHRASVASVAIQALTHSAPAPDFVPLAQLLHSAYPHTPFASEHADAISLPLALGSHTRTRPVLKVQDGCGNRCSFCVIPETRGPSRSVPLAQAIAAAQAFAGRGGQELVLSGINLGRWGRDLDPATYGRRTFADLVQALLEETSLPRLRISSVEPMDWTHELLALFARYSTGEHPRLAPHAHLPLQSGSDSILRRMHRRYRPWHYAQKLQQIRALLPHAAIGADVMVGFPGETDSLFAESLAFIQAQPLTYLHLFPFSPRPRTPAAGWHAANPVPAGTVATRTRALRQLAQDKGRAFAQGFVGQALSALSLQDNTALTANFLSVLLPAHTKPNQMLSLRIASIQEQGTAAHTGQAVRLTGSPEFPVAR
jgi:threonylcarbamoyladenosine tRNA methylthiotransferase MtaB